MDKEPTILDYIGWGVLWCGLLLCALLVLSLEVP